MKQLTFVFFACLLLTTFAKAQTTKDSESLVMTIETKIKKDGGSVALYNSVEKVITEAGRSNLSIKKVAYQRGQSKFKLIEAYSFTDGRKSPVAGSSIKTANLKSA